MKITCDTYRFYSEDTLYYRIFLYDILEQDFFMAYRFNMSIKEYQGILKSCGAIKTQHSKDDFVFLNKENCEAAIVMLKLLY